MSETTLGALAHSGVLLMSDGYRTKQAELSSEGFRIIRVADVKDGRVTLDGPDFVNVAYEKQIGLKRATVGDVLLTTKGTVGRVAIVSDGIGRSVYSPQLCWFRILNAATLQPRYLSYWLQSDAFLSQSSYMQGNTDMAPYISLADLRRAKISLRPHREQQAIAEVLGALDDKIAANNILVGSAIGLAYAEFGRRFLGRQLDVPLGSLANIVDCLHSKKPEQQEQGPTLMQLKNISENGLVDRTYRYSVSSVDYFNWSRRFETRAWDAVITNVGRIGAVARIPQGYSAALGRNMTGVRPHNASESGAFIVSSLLSPPVRHEIEMRTDAGSVMNALNVRSIPLLRLPQSTPEERTDYHAFAEPLFEVADAALAENASLAATRDALLPQLMSGKLRVRDAEAIAADAGA